MGTTVYCKMWIKYISITKFLFTFYIIELRLIQNAEIFILVVFIDVTKTIKPTIIMI
jgi:hypothetical protein